ncbi:LPXTG cell wall anchor domain-containing protein, partial [Lacticaseibacillus paracasei]|uniref:LPXTG cell wall anchor domain-containing protein n=1 Tax=Lacticaseibacillus paracasei TaxID=1597 RepID=UPI0021A2E0B8
KKEQAKQQPIIDTANATIQTAQGWINRKQGIVDDAQQKSNAANTWLAEKQAELKNEQTKQQAIINAANAEIITRNSFVNRKQDAYNAAQKAHAAAITDEEKAATETQLQKAYQDLQKEKGIRDAAVLSQNKIISTAQGWINRKQAIVNDAQSKANATNTWLTQKQAELAKEQAKQQPIIDAANATIQTAQGWINRKQAIVNDAQSKANAANTWLTQKQAELAKEQAKQQPIIDAANVTIQTAQGWINRKQAIVNDAQSKANVANTWLTQKQAELKKEEDKQQPIIDKAKKDIEVAAANVALANKAYKAALSWMEGFNQGVQDFKSGYAFRPGTAFGQDYITGYKTGYDLASQCANNETNINNQPSSIVNSVTNNSSSQPSTNTVNMPQTTENKKEALVHNTLPQTGDAINITSVLAGVVAILGSLFGLSSMRGRGNNK